MTDLSAAQHQPQQVLTQETNDVPTKSQTRYLDTATAYDLWSEVYDTDGNFLQALDTIQMKTLLPRAISLLSESSKQPQQLNPKDNSTIPSRSAIDLGCGTGRNTLLLLDHPSITSITALDLSSKMLDIARSRCQDHSSQTQPPSSSSTPQTLHFQTFDMLTHPSTVPPPTAPANLVISTLVLEHIPLEIFFHTASTLLAPNGILLLTNMHPEMGRISQAGFVDPKTGDKIRPTSYAHTIAETVVEARRAGFELLGGVDEVSVQEEMMERLGIRGRKWIGVRVWFGGVWRKVG